MEALTDKYPLPWSVDDFGGAYDIVAANGARVFERTDYTGDGDSINLEYEQMVELVDMVNSMPVKAKGEE